MPVPVAWFHVAVTPWPTIVSTPLVDSLRLGRAPASPATYAHVAWEVNGLVMMCVLDRS